ncbi:MAG TPA: hypothetical protein VG368_03860 [Acidimicrobiales bacterium]|nr:hypothetical protein [Acidimicrobiales bacterium]
MIEVAERTAKVAAPAVDVQGGGWMLRGLIQIVGVSHDLTHEGLLTFVGH